MFRNLICLRVVLSDTQEGWLSCPAMKDVPSNPFTFQSITKRKLKADLMFSEILMPFKNAAEFLKKKMSIPLIGFLPPNNFILLTNQDILKIISQAK